MSGNNLLLSIFGLFSKLLIREHEKYNYPIFEFKTRSHVCLHIFSLLPGRRPGFESHGRGERLDQHNNSGRGFKFRFSSRESLHSPGFDGGRAIRMPSTSQEPVRMERSEPDPSVLHPHQRLWYENFGHLSNGQVVIENVTSTIEFWLPIKKAAPFLLHFCPLVPIFRWG